MRGARQHDEKDTLAVAPWYWRDWRASKARAFLLSTKNWLGYVCYRELLDAHWGEQDCTLPGDDAELAALAGVALEEWLSVKDVIVRWMNANSDGRLRNPRAFREWQKAKLNRTSARKKARKAAKALWDKKKEKPKEPSLEHAPSFLQACPPTPTPSPTPSPTPIERKNERSERPIQANPLIAGRRPELESEALRLTREIAEIDGRDPTEVIADAAHYEGATRQKVNPASMTDDRLANTLIDLRATLANLQAKQRLQAAKAR